MPLAALAARSALQPRTVPSARCRRPGSSPWSGHHSCGTAPGSHRTSLTSVPLRVSRSEPNLARRSSGAQSQRHQGSSRPRRPGRLRVDRCRKIVDRLARPEGALPFHRDDGDGAGSHRPPHAVRQHGSGPFVDAEEHHVIRRLPLESRRHPLAAERREVREDRRCSARRRAPRGTAADDRRGDGHGSGSTPQAP